MTTSNHRSLQDTTKRVPSSTGDRGFEITFDAPGLSSTTSTHARPYPSYRVAPIGDSGTQLVIELNQTEIVNLSYNTTVNRTMTEDLRSRGAHGDRQPAPGLRRRTANPARWTSRTWS